MESHEHPLVQSKQSELASPTITNESCSCARCGEVILWGPFLSCSEPECGFYLHKECAEAPSEMNHPFHRNHPLSLSPTPPAKYSSGRFICNFCGEEGEKFVYNCSDCEFDLHIKCALFTYNLAEKKLRPDQLKPIACKDPSISTENGNSEVASIAKCLGCWEPLLATDSTYYSLDRGINLHRKCAELASEINYPGHNKHPLILQLGDQFFSCVICQDTQRRGFFYCCSICNFFIHIACLSPPSVIEDKGHPHPFTLLFRRFPFTCDACGEEGNCFPYMCSTCNLLIHKRCISLPSLIKFTWHEHPIFHTYFVQRHESGNGDCVLCLKEVNIDHGSYYCSDCHFIVHVNCVLKKEGWYYIIEPHKLLEYNLLDMNSFTVIEENKDGEAIVIKHFSHEHNLMLSTVTDKVVKDDTYCDGCIFSISDSFYYCSQCDFLLHKVCAESPKKKHDWLHLCQKPFTLASDQFFKCCCCMYVSNGLSYTCKECKSILCLQCANLPDTVTSQGHEHPLFFCLDYEGQCNAFGEERTNAYKCKVCNFAVGGVYLTLPCTTRHKCDEHLLTLTYHDHDTYSKRHFCDICEEDRNPNHWFCHCAICDTSVHPQCVLGKGRYPRMKLEKSYDFEDHPHLLTLVKKMYYYPKCYACEKPCLDLALECREPGCEYIIHWNCFGYTSVLVE